MKCKNTTARPIKAHVKAVNPHKPIIHACEKGRSAESRALCLPPNQGRGVARAGVRVGRCDRVKAAESPKLYSPSIVQIEAQTLPHKSHICRYNRDPIAHRLTHRASRPPHPRPGRAPDKKYTRLTCCALKRRRDAGPAGGAACDGARAGDIAHRDAHLTGTPHTHADVRTPRRRVAPPSCDGAAATRPRSSPHLHTSPPQPSTSTSIAYPTPLTPIRGRSVREAHAHAHASQNSRTMR